MKIVFAGTPAFAVPSLNRIAGTHEVAAVVTQPDRPMGRKRVLTPPPVKEAAFKLGIPVLQPESLKKDHAALQEIGADLLVTCAFGQILTQEVLDLFPMGVWNIHASLLPHLRGAAPIARAVMEGDAVTGITIMRTDIGLDTGDILLQRQIPIEKRDTAGTLAEKLAVLGADLIAEALPLIERGNYILTPQKEGDVCKKVQRTEVDFSCPAEEVSRLIRGLSPAPSSFASAGELTVNFYDAEEVPCDLPLPCGTVFGDAKRGMFIRCGKDAVKIGELQPAGGKRMRGEAFMNGKKEGLCFERLS